MGGDDTLITVGRIVRPHGIRGDVKVTPITDWPERFKEFHLIYLERSNEKSGWVQIEQARMLHNHIILKLSGIDSRGKAETLKNAELRVRGQDLPSLPEGHYYVHDMMGMTISTMDGRIVGSVVDVIQMSLQDIYVVEADGKEVLIPAVETFIKKVDTKKRMIWIDPIEGLIDIDED